MQVGTRAHGCHCTMTCCVTCNWCITTAVAAQVYDLFRQRPDLLPNEAEGLSKGAELLYQ